MFFRFYIITYVFLFLHKYICIVTALLITNIYFYYRKYIRIKLINKDLYFYKLDNEIFYEIYMIFVFLNRLIIIYK